MTPLVAILGAGASRGSGDYLSGGYLPGDSVLPPLTVDLFNEERYAQVLRKYDLAHQAGRLITEQLAQDDALGLEHALHGLSISSLRHHKHMALAVPPYLQDLLHRVSDARYTEALHYDRLIERLLRLPYVFFVSLNYDVLLDRRLSAHHFLSDLDAYINDNRWSLIKPHGSVNWYHPANGYYFPATPPIDLVWKSSKFACVPPNFDLSDIRSDDPETPTDRYPALAMPEGPDDTLVLPHAHQSFFFGRLESTREIDVLVIGYSGLDRKILDHIVRSGCKVRRMTVVSQDHATAAQVLERFRASGLEPVWPNVVDGDFASWSNDGGLNRLVDEYNGPYS